MNDKHDKSNNSFFDNNFVNVDFLITIARQSSNFVSPFYTSVWREPCIRFVIYALV